MQLQPRINTDNHGFSSDRNSFFHDLALHDLASSVSIGVHPWLKSLVAAGKRLVGVELNERNETRK